MHMHIWSVKSRVYALSKPCGRVAGKERGGEHVWVLTAGAEARGIGILPMPRTPKQSPAAAATAQALSLKATAAECLSTGCCCCKSSVVELLLLPQVGDDSGAPSPLHLGLGLFFPHLVIVLCSASVFACTRTHIITAAPKIFLNIFFQWKMALWWNIFYRKNVYFHQPCLSLPSSNHQKLIIVSSLFPKKVWTFQRRTSNTKLIFSSTFFSE